VSEEIRDAYFAIRRKHSVLREIGWRFEGEPWHTVGKAQVRYGSDGWRLVVRRVEDGFGVIVVEPDGREQSFA